MAFKALDYPLDSPQIQKPLAALKRFQQHFDGELPNIPKEITSLAAVENTVLASITHQQCCVSPVWDTPWALTALLESGVSPANPALLKSGELLISKQITNPRGDWRFKNPKGEPGGWSFEFENEYFPDVDDTIQVLTVLKELQLPEIEKEKAMQRGL